MSVHDIVEAIRPVIDPDFGHSIVDLGLLREVTLSPDGKHAHVHMTLTSPACPLAPELMAAVKAGALSVNGVESAEVDLVWSPPWDPRLDATEEVLADMGIWDL